MPIQEVEIHYVRPKVEAMPKVTSVEEAERQFRLFSNPKRIDLKEFFWVMLLSNSNHMLGIAEVGTGNTSQTVVNVKEVFQLVLRSNASGVILCHNHPSGNLKPSDMDIRLCKEINQFAKLLGVSLLDSLILTSESVCSFKEEGLI